MKQLKKSKNVWNSLRFILGEIYVHATKLLRVKFSLVTCMPEQNFKKKKLINYWFYFPHN